MNQNGSVQLGEKAAEYILSITFIYYTLENSVLSLAHHLYISIILLREGYALLKCFSLCTRSLMHSDRITTDAISESMIQVLHCRAVSHGVMYCIGYSSFDNVVCITACFYTYCVVLFSL